MSALGPPKKERGELASKNAQQKYDARYKFLRSVQHLSDAVSLWIEHECARIETSHELAKWNLANERSTQ